MENITNTTENFTKSTMSTEDGSEFQVDKIYIAVGVGGGLLLSLALLGIIGALACRGQHVRSGHRGRRLQSTVSMAYSDFDSYKASKPYYIYSPTAPSTLTSRVPTSATTSHNTTFNDSIDNIKPFPASARADVSGESRGDHSRQHRNLTNQDPETGIRVMDRGGNPHLAGSSQPEMRNTADAHLHYFETKILSPTYLGRDMGDEYARSGRTERDRVRHSH